MYDKFYFNIDEIDRDLISRVRYAVARYEINSAVFDYRDKGGILNLEILVKLFKVAPFDISNYNILNHIVKKRKPTILSTGMSSFKEINIKFVL